MYGAAGRTMETLPKKGDCEVGAGIKTRSSLWGGGMGRLLVGLVGMLEDG